jgi:hypothetical protein
MKQEFWEVTNAALLAVLKVLVPILAAYLAAELKRVLAGWRLEAEARAGRETLEMARGIIRAAILAAEESGALAKLRGEAFDKFEDALERAETNLEAQGIYLDASTIVTEIVGMVHDEFNRDRTDREPAQPAEPDPAQLPLPLPASDPQ